jgi:hypothetical protein
MRGPLTEAGSFTPRVRSTVHGRGGFLPNKSLLIRLNRVPCSRFQNPFVLLLDAGPLVNPGLLHLGCVIFPLSPRRRPFADAHDAFRSSPPSRVPRSPRPGPCGLGGRWLLCKGARARPVRRQGLDMPQCGSGLRRYPYQPSNSTPCAALSRSLYIVMEFGVLFPRTSLSLACSPRLIYKRRHCCCCEKTGCTLRFPPTKSALAPVHTVYTRPRAAW